MSWIIKAFALALLTTLPVCAHANEPEPGPVYDNKSVNYTPPPTERRGGFAMALTSSYGVGEYHGYPLEVAALNDPSRKQSTRTSLASNLSLWLGGSLRDWLTCGVGFSFMGAALNDNIGSDASLLFRVETFPLYSLGGFYRDLGLGLSGGIGMALLADKEDKKFEDPVAESGALSTLGLSVFWEPIQFWHISLGPALNYTHAFSQTMTVNQITLGIRTAIYGVQPRRASTSPTPSEQARHGSFSGSL